jgi:hypothetical protein
MSHKKYRYDTNKSLSRGQTKVRHKNCEPKKYFARCAVFHCVGRLKKLAAFVNNHIYPETLKNGVPDPYVYGPP